ncbi:hypothetical protein GCM10007886_02610 [Methylobacterium gregans]|uniref:Uncharacterized protein n=1 Tax=Methylobacterium gregans TaxID=374424 RepID=A0AA37HPW4_9HYPH|nr:hypothetical protein [Methylobacterium gregans]GJD79481.1 hypothetical protein NBEOAGPD_2708 [Methylobacterium gregans]GLS52079.1 hypothetical protein GCM10007886_02610 [Methylobacterium gregans]
MTKLDAKTLKAVTGGTSKCEPTPPACPPAKDCGGKSKKC